MITRLGTYSQVKGSSYKIPCIVATTGSITLSGTQTIDGVAVVAGDRVLVKNQGTGSDNGIYIVSSTAWSRAIDMSVTDDVYTGLQIYINSGTTNGSKVFILTTANPIILGTTALTFTLLTNQTITLSGDVSGSGTGAITTTIGASKVTNSMLAGSISYAKMDSATVPTWNQNTTGTASNITSYTINQNVGTGNSVTFAGILSNGAINATGDITAYYSDVRLKEDLQPIENALSKVLSLCGYTYNTNKLGKELLNIENDERQVGLIAQDLKLVQPEAVKLAPFDRNENGQSKSGKDYLTIQYEKVVPLLVEAIKAQQKQIDDLKFIINGITK